MIFIFKQSTGELFDVEGKLLHKGYSGFGIGKNNPAMQGVSNVGPLPIGSYKIEQAHDSSIHGPLAMRLTPLSGTDTLGRSGFMIHGDSVKDPGTASHGCVIEDRATREAIASFAANDNAILHVVS